MADNSAIGKHRNIATFEIECDCEWHDGTMKNAKDCADRTRVECLGRIERENDVAGKWHPTGRRKVSIMVETAFGELPNLGQLGNDRVIDGVPLGFALVGWMFVVGSAEAIAKGVRLLPNAIRVGSNFIIGFSYNDTFVYYIECRFEIEIEI